ncbi:MULTISPECIES: hypothetical protein, partial [unclassified Fusobacterium]
LGGNNMRVIYTKETISKADHVINLSEEDFFKVYPNGDNFHDRPELNDENHIVMVDQDRVLEYPTYDKVEDTIREMTREEKIVLLNQTDLLADGEVVTDGTIKTVECSEDFVQAKWNKEKACWEEGANKESLMIDRKNKILEYAKYKKEIEELKEFSDEFESDETIVLLQSKMEALKEEINALLTKIKKIK